MPYYDLKCPKCEAEYPDVKRTVSEISSGVRCEKCGEQLEIVHDTPIAFVLKGNGWSK